MDYGISGTSTKNRDDFNRLIADCLAGRIDVVLVKSISRFARNTVDCLTYTRMLRERGIDVFFERENIHSMSDDGELLLTLLASFAQEESRNLSENVRWRVRKGFQEGKQNGARAPYGYRWDGECYRIIPEQAEVVREIYRRYLSGESAYSIAWSLGDRGVTGQNGGPIEERSVKTILANRSYTGDQILQKHYIAENHKRMRNHGELDRYLVEGMYEPIVTVEDYEKAVSIMEQRAETYGSQNGATNPFTGKVICGCCGRHASLKTTKWICNSKNRRSRKKCAMVPLHHDELLAAAEGIHFQSVTIYDDCIEFLLANGSRKKVYRQYKHRTAFSGRLICSTCGAPLYRKRFAQQYFYWACRRQKPECSLHRVHEDELRSVTQALLGEHYEAAFAKEVKQVLVSNEEFCFEWKDGSINESIEEATSRKAPRMNERMKGEVITWPRS